MSADASDSNQGSTTARKVTAGRQGGGEATGCQLCSPPVPCLTPHFSVRCADLAGRQGSAGQDHGLQAGAPVRGLCQAGQAVKQARWFPAAVRSTAQPSRAQRARAAFATALFAALLLNRLFLNSESERFVAASCKYGGCIPEQGVFASSRRSTAGRVVPQIAPSEERTAGKAATVRGQTGKKCK